MVLFDATILLLLLHPDTSPPIDPATKLPVTKARERIDFLIHTLGESGSKIIIPTPVLSEVLVWAGRAGSSYIPVIERSAVFRIEPFDTRAAVEVALLTASALKSGNKKGLSKEQTWAKIKYDRQIIAIAKVAHVSTIYSDDESLSKLARSHSISVIRLASLPLPQEDQQMGINWESKAGEDEASHKTD
ncbi:MAG TPA: hypothetical protein PKD12_09160 [Nitrospira sp.]|nr:hypothetical protein [Nitrospira sp.]